MRIQAASREEVFQALMTAETGLTAAEAARRLHDSGVNEIRKVSGTSWHRQLLAQFTHFLAILLWLAAALSFLSDYLHPGEGMFTLGMAIIGVIVINALFTFLQEYRAERAVAALKRLLPFNVTVRRDGESQEIPAREVVPGDVVLLAEGDKAPADARLIDASRLMVNNAPLTGESAPRPRSPEPFSGEYLESPNLVFAGTLVVSGRGAAVVLATGMATEFGKIAHYTSAMDPGLSPLQQEIVRVTRIIALIAGVMGLVFFSLGFWMGRGFWHNFLFAVGIIVANVPEGLLPTVTLSLAMGSQRLASKQALVKNLTSVETLGAITVICSDKTGTLTQNRMEVRQAWTPPALEEDEGAARQFFWEIAYFCNNAQYRNGRYHGDPTEAALLKAARQALGDPPGRRLREIPFDAERKRMTTVTWVAGQTLVLTKGALETVLPQCRHLQTGNVRRALADRERLLVQEACHTLTAEGLRVIALARREVAGAPDTDVGADEAHWERDLTLVGLVGLEDPPRPEVKAAVAQCRQAGIRVIMITGDAGRTAAAVAREIGLVSGQPTVIEGPTLQTLADADILRALAAPEVIFARMTPRHKLRLVSLLQERGERVAVTGDGVNDAPALKKADIGIAMGLVGTDVAREAADLVLLDDNFATIVAAVEEGRGVFDNLRKFMTYIFASNVPEIVPYLAFVLFQIPLPLTILQILAVDLGTDLFPALALGAEKPSVEVMHQPPRSPKERLLTPGLLARAYLFLGPLEALAAMAGFFAVLFAGGWQWGQSLGPPAVLYLTATTACLAGIVVAQMGNVFACRTTTASLFAIGVFSNPLVLFGLAAEILMILFIVYHPWGQAIFGTAALSWQVWLFLAPFAVGLLFLEEVRKFMARRRQALSG